MIKVAELSNGIPVTIHVVTQNIQDNQVVGFTSQLYFPVSRYLKGY